MALLKPTDAEMTPTVKNIRKYNHFTQNYMLDRKIVTMFELPSITGNTAANELKSHGNGNAELLEINSSEIAGFTLDADDESFGFQILVPHDLDPDEQIDFRYLWSNSEAASTGSVQFVTTYQLRTPSTTNSSAIAVAATALDDVHDNQTDIAANCQIWSPWGSISAGNLSDAVPGDSVLYMKVKVDLTTCADATLYAGQMRYYRRYL